MTARLHKRFSITVSLAILALAALPLSGRAGEVGVAAAVNPNAYISADGAAPIQLKIGNSIFSNQHINTAGAGVVQILLHDGSTFTLGPNSDLVINNPDKNAGEVVATLSKGVLRVVGGKLSKNDGGVKVNTPAGTAAIHSGMFDASVNGKKGLFSFHHGDELTLTSDGRTHRAFEPGYMIDSTGANPTIRKSTPNDTAFFNNALSVPPVNPVALLAPVLTGKRVARNVGQHKVPRAIPPASPSPPPVVTQTPPPASPPPPVVTQTPPPASPPPVVAQTPPPAPPPPPVVAQTPPPASPSPPPVTTGQATTLTGYASGIVEHNDGSIPDAVLNGSPSDLSVNFDAKSNSPAGNIQGQVRPFTQPISNAASQMIGVNISGAEFAGQGTGFAKASDLDYLRSQGITLIRLPISWEQMQSTLNGPLNKTYLAGLKTFLAAAAARGMEVIVDVHNQGRYDSNPANLAIHERQHGLGYAIGSPQVSTSAFVDFWTKLATALKGHRGIYAYDLMNEPHDMGGGGTEDRGGSPVWKQAAQSAVNGIRSVDMKTTILVEGTHYSAANNWQQYNGNFIIKDPANNLLYEAHQYFDDGGGGGGTYANSYAKDGATPNTGVSLLQPWLDWLKQNNVKGFLGEFAIPNNDPAWKPVLQNVIADLNANGISGTMWAYRLPSGYWPANIFLNPIDGKTVQQLTVLQQQTHPVITSFSANEIVGSNVLTLTGTAVAGTTIHILDGSKEIGTTTADATGGWNFTTGQLSGDQHSFTATQNNPQGSASSASAAVSTAVNVVTLSGTPDAHTVGAGGGFCTSCAFIKWGTWSTPANSATGDTVHSGWWVAGDVARNDELPKSGKATYTGSAVGNVSNNLDGGGWQTYVATGDTTMTWNFASRSGNLLISGFDKSVAPNGLSFGGPMSAPGQLASAPNQFGGVLTGTGAAGPLVGAANGSFVKGPQDTAANTIGNFKVGNPSYIAAGIFAGTR